MDKFAVIKINNRQYIVKEGDEILVDKLKDKQVAPEVLMVVDKDKLRLGKPIVKNAKVKIKIVKNNVKGKKITVLKYRAKSKYRRKLGFRPRFSQLQVIKIS